MPTIRSVTARQILDSRGRPTVEATVALSDGTFATSSAPSGSIGNEQIEALELRDHNPAEYFGYGVNKAINFVNTEIQQALVGQDPLYQTKIDQTLVDLDGTKNKSRLGANSILAVSQAVMKSATASLHLPLFVYVKEKYQLIDAYRIPSPIFNLINGGRHGGGTLDFQEFQLVPASHLPYTQALKIGAEMFMAIEQVLQQKGALTNVGLEGGFAPNLATNSDALEIMGEAAKTAGYTLSKDAFLGIDLGPSHFYKSGKYTIKDRSQPMGGKDFIKYLKNLHEQYRVFAFEDPLMPDAWSDWKFLTSELGETAMIIADDLTATNKTLLMKAIEEQACNAIVIKPNRIGTITEAIEIASIAKKAGWHTVMSHRSSETTDDILADIAVGIGTDYVKFGAPSRGERVVKYNRLLRIEEILRSSGQPEPTPATPAAPPSPASPPQQPPAAPVNSPSEAAPPAPAPAHPPMPTPTPQPTQEQTMTTPSPAQPTTTPAAPTVSAPPNPATTISPVEPVAPAPSHSASPEPTPAAPPPATPVSPAGAASQATSPAAIPAPQPTPATPPLTVPAIEKATPPTEAAPSPTPQPAAPEPLTAPAEVFSPAPAPTMTAPRPATDTPDRPPAQNTVAPAGAPDEAAEVQDSLNELVQMAQTTPAAGNIPPAATPSLEVTPAPAPTISPDIGGLPRPVPPTLAPPAAPAAAPAQPATSPATTTAATASPEPESSDLQPPQPPSSSTS